MDKIKNALTKNKIPPKKDCPTVFPLKRYKKPQKFQKDLKNDNKAFLSFLGPFLYYLGAFLYFLG